MHAETTMISVLPGSRLQEVKRMLPIFEGALGILRKAYPEITAVIPTVPSVRVTKTVEDAVASWDVPAILLPGASQQQKYDAFAVSGLHPYLWSLANRASIHSL